MNFWKKTYEKDVDIIFGFRRFFFFFLEKHLKYLLIRKNNMEAFGKTNENDVDNIFEFRRISFFTEKYLKWVLK